MQLLGQDSRQLGRGSDADQLHVTILDHFMCKVLSDVKGFGARQSADDVVPPYNSSCVVLTHRGRILLSKTHALEKVAARRIEINGVEDAVKLAVCS